MATPQKKRQPTLLSLIEDIDALNEFLGIDPKDRDAMSFLHEFPPRSSDKKSVDERGHRDTVRINVPQGLSGHISTVTELLPEYRTTHDFIRSWIMRGLRFELKRLGYDEDGTSISMPVSHCMTFLVNSDSEIRQAAREAMNATIGNWKEDLARFHKQGVSRAELRAFTREFDSIFEGMVVNELGALTVSQIKEMRKIEQALDKVLGSFSDSTVDPEHASDMLRRGPQKRSKNRATFINDGLTPEEVEHMTAPEDPTIG